mgnify:CR=1 FL=1
MQSFSYKAKAELCRGTVQRLCCARAECYGALLYCCLLYRSDAADE